MADFEINELTSVGLVKDMPPHQLPPEAWNISENIRFCDGTVGPIGGWTTVFGAPTIAPHFAMSVLAADLTPWLLYASLTKIYVFRGGVHTNITRQTAAVDVDYTAQVTEDWNGTLLGGIPILNNGQDVPQFWSAYSASQKMQDLTNWPSTLRAKTITAFGPFLFACHLTDSGVEYPHAVRWSHPADPGAVPSSWSISDPTKDGGQVEIPSDNAGSVMTAVPMHDFLYIYKHGVISRAQFVGGRSVFSFHQFLGSAGAISRRAVAVTPDGNGHVFMSEDDILFHDGQTVRSIVDGRIRRAIFDSLNVATKGTVFSFVNRKHREVWICYPSQGASYPDRAVIWDMRTGAIASEVTEVDFRGAVVGYVEEGLLGDWNTDVLSWNSDTSTWGSIVPAATVVLDPVNLRFGLMGEGIDRFGTGGDSRNPVISILERRGLSLLGRTNKGDPIVDFKRWKLFTRVWIKAEGGAFDVRVGVQDFVDGGVDWSNWKQFDPKIDTYVDFARSGRAIAIAFRGIGESQDFKLHGYKAEVHPLGTF